MEPTAMSTAVAKPRPQNITPRSPFTAFRQEMEELMSRFWEGAATDLSTGTFSPTLDLSETDNAYEVRMDVPGMEAKDIDVQVHGNVVTLSGSRKEERTEKGKTFHRMERRTGAFSRTLTLPCSIKEDEVAAEYTGGVLTVALPKCEKERARRISVKG
jgi:HSP20 family protein